jgi:hypothetical protein
VVHFDVYLAGRGGVTIEESVIPLSEGAIAVGPTVSVGVGSRMWLAERTALKLELRDDFQLQSRSVTESTHLKQNANIILGVTMLSPPKERR